MNCLIVFTAECGTRSIPYENYSGSLDWNYIETECEKLGIADFEKQSRELALKTFAASPNTEISEMDKRMLEYYLTSDTYGTLENAVRVRRKKYADKTGKRLS